MKINLLIVDDIAENIYALEVLFEELEIESRDFTGLNIFRAQTREEVLRITLKEKIDLILLDVHMPGMDGFQVAEFLKMSKKTADIPIVFLTAEYKSDEFVNKVYKVGALDYFIKPIEKSQFLNKMRIYIQLFLSQKIREKEFSETLSEYMALVDKYIISSDVDVDGKFTRVSQAFCNISGYTKDELIDNSHRMVRAPDITEQFYKEIVDVISADKTWEGHIENRTKGNRKYWTESLISQKYDKDKRIVGYTWIEHDITDKKKLEKISITDGLTNIFNRRYFDENTPRIINSIKRNNTFVCFALIDIDYFKKYNDTYGHQQGDAVLRKVADIFRLYARRASDYCFRIGGEEFCIVFSADGKKEAFDFMKKIKDGVEGMKIRHAGSSVSRFVTISIGLTCERCERIPDITSLFNDTDRLLYKAKETGRNRLVANFALP